MSDKIKEVLMFGFESQDFVNDLIGKERLDQAAHQLNQMLIEARIEELDKAHTANSLGEWADYFLERRESLAQLAKGEDNHADQ